MSNLINFLEEFYKGDDEEFQNNKSNNSKNNFKEEQKENLFNNKEEQKQLCQNNTEKQNVSNFKKLKLNKEKNKNIEKNVCNSKESDKDIQKEENLLKELFEKSETSIVYKNKWIELYQKSLSSDKKTITNDKIKRGKFRFNEKGKIEILPDHETSGKSSKNILNEVWFDFDIKK